MRPAFEARAQRVLLFARDLEQTVESWADFSNELYSQLDGLGLVTRLFPTIRERQQFLDSPENKEIRQMMERLMQRFGVLQGAEPLYTVGRSDRDEYGRA